MDGATVREIEERSLEAWPAVHELTRLGWALRWSGGRSRRANAASALAPTGTLGAIMAEAGRFYRLRDQPCLFRITPLAPADADAALAAAGFGREGDCLVMVRDLIAPVAAPLRPLLTAGVAQPFWRAGSAAASALTPADAAARDAIVDRIRPLAVFAAVLAGETPAAYGLAVAEQGWVGLFAIVAAPEARRMGLGRHLVRGLLGWGRDHGAGRAYLQVDAGNAAALALYQNEGFTEAYRYHYRQKR